MTKDGAPVDPVMYEVTKRLHFRSAEAFSNHQVSYGLAVQNKPGNCQER